MSNCELTLLRAALTNLEQAGQLVQRFAGHVPFADLRNRDVWLALRGIVTDGDAPGVIALLEAMARAGTKIGPQERVYVSAIPDPGPVLEYELKHAINSVWAAYQQRRAAELADENARALQSHPLKAPMILATWGNALRDLARDGAPTIATARPWVDVRLPDDDDSVLIGPGRWLTRGSGCFLVGPTGSGKSTWTATQSFAWALGRESLGFVPTRPLKSLVIQAEDDDGDLAAMRDGVVETLRLTQADAEQVRANVLIVTERAKTGVAFLHDFVAPLLRTIHPDLLWLNPVAAFFGDDLSDQQAVAAFFRNTLNPILAEHRCAAFPIHHTGKPSQERKEWEGHELAYYGLGSSDLANWSRETIVLRSTGPGLYEMTCTKRWRKLGWRDPDGKPTPTRQIAHSTNGVMLWRDATPDVLEELGAVPYSDSRMLELVPEAGIDYSDLVKLVAENFSLAKRTATNYVMDARRPRRHNVNGTVARYALLTEKTRPRRDVHPESPSGRDVVWLTRAEIPS